MCNLIVTVLVSVVFIRWFTRRFNVDWNRRRWRNYEAERAMQTLRGLLLFFFVAGILSLALAGGWNP